MASHDSAYARYWPVAKLGVLVVIGSGYWLKQINQNVPEPYMDEIFHVPQAQQYCSGDYFTWDPKLTTPPGLYALSMLLKSVLPISFWPGKEAPRDSRPFIEKEGVDVLSKAAETLFDPGCHITELRSIGTLALGLMFLVCWQIRRTVRPNTNSKTGNGGWWALSEAAATAQNICFFPPMFFFSGLYYTDVLSTFVVMLAYCAHLWRVKGTMSMTHNILSGVVVYGVGVLALTMRQTNIFWAGIFLAGLEWTSACQTIAPAQAVQKNGRQTKANKNWQECCSIAYSHYAEGQLQNPALSDAGPLDFLQCLLSLAISAINNPLKLLSHVWPHISLLLTFLAFVLWNGSVVLGDKANHVATIHLPQLLYLAAFLAFFSFPLFLPSIISLFRDIRTLSPPCLSTIIWFTAATVMAMVVVHFNTIIHPFTLADNRHFMFYIFRYTILRHWAVKYLLCPLYILSGWFVLSTLAGPTSKSTQAQISSSRPGAPSASSGVTTAFIAILLITTTLSLITAPLVEPRYFILPYVFWRLHIACYPAGQERVMTWMERVWYMVINIATCWIFINKTFEWPSEPGLTQRFMW